MNTVYEKLKETKNEKKEKRLGKLQEICSDDNIDEAIEIAKHESSLDLPIAAFLTALLAVFLNFLSVELLRYIFFFFWMSSMWFLIEIRFNKWKEVYYDLLELKRMRRVPSVD